MYNNKPRVGVSQSIKIEKENENIELRKRIKDLSKDKYWRNKKENVWDRLSKMQRVPSIENKLGATKSRSYTANISQRSKVVKHIVTNPSEYQQRPRKPLSPNSASSNNKRSDRLDAPKKLRTQISTAVHEIKPQMFAYSKEASRAFEEILTVRSLSQSKSSSDEKRYQKQSKSSSLSQRSNSDGQCYNIGARKNMDKKCDEFSEDSNEEYKLAPLMVSPSQDSMKILENINEFLCCKERSFPTEDIVLVKDVIKSDQRYRDVDKNPELFKEILETQLGKILKHEIAVKNALESLDFSSNTKQSHSSDIGKPVNEIVSYSNFNQDTQKLEVDVVFKNVPSLEKEIVILRALGEKLEATLKNTSFHREQLVASTRGVIAPITDVILKNVRKYLPVFYELKYEIYILCESHIEYSVRTIGVRLSVGVVKEFLMAEKTILELKLEASRPFYIPVCTDASELRRTSFERLTSNPDEFLRYIKPKNCKVTFNLLEQDSIFFKSLFNKTLKHSSTFIDLSEKTDVFEDERWTTVPPLSEGGDSQIWKQTVHNKQIQYKIKQPMDRKDNNDAKSELESQPYHFEPIIRGKQRRSIRRCLTPMPVNSYCNPKNSLFKTVLVGCVQMSIFIIFIMALTYPDFIC